MPIHHDENYKYDFVSSSHTEYMNSTNFFAYIYSLYCCVGVRTMVVARDASISGSGRVNAACAERLPRASPPFLSIEEADGLLSFRHTFKTYFLVAHPHVLLSGRAQTAISREHSANL